MRIGVTFYLGSGSIWNSGAVQQCIFLCRLLRNAGHDVIPINIGNCTPAAGLMLSGLGLDFASFNDVADSLDVLIEAAAQVSAQEVERVRNHGGRAVGYRFGNNRVIDSERIIKNQSPGSIFNGARFDEIWTNEQHMNTCGAYWETCYRAPVRSLPHIWDSTFVDAAVREFPEGLLFGYQPRSEPKRIGIFEPNIDIVKTAITPMLVCEDAYRGGAKLGNVYVTNALEIKKHLTFQKFASNLDIVRDGLCSFEDRFKAPWFLAKFCDVVVSHQWECALNFAYYDALHGGYPLVHNSDLLPDGVGYRYSGFDNHDGGRLLAWVLQHHDSVRDAYEARARAFLSTLGSAYPANVQAYDRALADVRAERRAA